MSTATERTVRSIEDTSWTASAMRWGQINIREIEPAVFDVAWWEDYWRRLRLDGITLNAGGLVAYYPTELEDQHRSPWLGDRDLFGELVEAVRRCDMRVLARIDPGESYEDVYFRHPDWFAVEADGSVMRDVSNPELYVPCMNGPYYREFVPRIIEEIHAKYDVDGIFCSEWDGRGRICHCVRCAQLFGELPQEVGDSTWKRWVRWHESRLADLWKFWDSTSRGIKPGAFFMGNHSEHGFLADGAEMINVDHQHRLYDEPLWAVGEQGKKMRAITRGEKPYFHIFSSYSYARHVAKPEAEYRLYVADAVLADSRPWFTMIGGVQEDKRQFGPLEDMYRWHFENQSYLRNRSSLAEVAIAFDDRDRFLPEDRRPDSFRGMYYALLRSRIPFDLVHVGRLEDDTLDRYRVLVLPNRACMTEAEAETIRRFVRRGGSVVATFETGARDEWGEPRAAGLLDDVLGVAGRYPAMGALEHSYSAVHGHHPLLDGLEATGLTLNSPLVCPVVAAEGTDASLLSLIPPYIYYPPEMSHSRTGDSGLPLLLVTEGTGSEGRRVYWPGDVDALVYKANSPDHLRMLGNAVRWALGKDQSVQVNGPGLIEVQPYRQAGNLQAHLVNFSSPDAWRAPVHELLPVGPLTIRMRIPDGERAADHARCLVSGQTLPVTVENGWAQAELPRLLDHEIVVLELS
ncbi:alpha-amylase family protein [Arthrobacter sp. 92]|uniref:alpha-amylase family protein n=1 Tax=Arthrobacter sp. 92 TaxID=3418175 RepID=UPI003D0096BF